MSQPSLASESRLLGTLQALILFVAGLVGAGIAVSSWEALAGPLGVAAGTTAFQLAEYVFQFAGLIAPVFLFVAAAGDRELLSWAVPDRRQTVVAAGAVVVLYVGQFVLVTAFSLVDVAPSQNPAIDPSGREPGYFLWMIAFSLLVVGPAEELFVRGGIQGLLTRAWGPWPAIVGASALFGSLHYIGGGSGALAYVVFSFLLGILLGYVYERTGNLVVPALAHGAFNAVAFGLQYLSVAG